MKIEQLKNLREVLSSIKKEEWNIENLQIEENYDVIPFEEYYEKVINKPANRKFKPKKVIATAMLGLSLVTGLSGVPSTSFTEDNLYKVEAKSKKDTKKPVIKFSGKSKITVEKGESVKIPKTTAKDNKDGNVTKKIKVTVKKGNKNFSKIAKAVKSNKKTKFTSTGTYKIKYTVADKAGNKASKTRTIKVVNPKEKIPTTTEKITTEIPTTEKITTETPTTEVPIEKEYPIYEYKIVDSSNEEIFDKICNVELSDFNDIGSDKITFDMEHDYSFLYFPDANHKVYQNGSEYLKYFGKIKAYDEYGNDISNNIIICESNNKTRIYIYVEDQYGNDAVKWFHIRFYDNIMDLSRLEYQKSEEGRLDILETNPPIYGSNRYIYTNQEKNTKGLGLKKVINQK